jgi:hypothetical protein
MRWLLTGCMQVPDLHRLKRNGWFATLVFPLSLGLGDPFPLALQHDLALPGGDSAQDSQHEFAGWVSRIEPFATNRKDQQSDAAP